jgi:hypothetical protein
LFESLLKSVMPDLSRRGSTRLNCQFGARPSLEQSLLSKADRELIALSKAHTLEAIADKLQRSPAEILKSAMKLGLSIKEGETKMSDPNKQCWPTAQR